MTVKVNCRKYGNSDSMIYNWKSNYGDLPVNESLSLTDLEDQKRQIKKEYS